MFLTNFVKANVVINSLECLHMIFVIFFSTTRLQYKQLKIKCYFSNESYNEEQEMGSIVLRSSSFLSIRIRKKIVLSLLYYYFFFYFSIYIGLVILN